MDRKSIDYCQLGRAHGTELAVLVIGMREQGSTVEAWREFLTHRMATVADDLRAAMATEEQVQTWARACRATYGAATMCMVAVDSSSDDAVPFAGLAPQGRG